MPLGANTRSRCSLYRISVYFDDDKRSLWLLALNEKRARARYYLGGKRGAQDVRLRFFVVLSMRTRFSHIFSPDFCILSIIDPLDT